MVVHSLPFLAASSVSLLSGCKKSCSYRQTLGEVKAVSCLRGGCWCAVRVRVDGAEKSGLMEAQLLQLLRVLCERGRKQQLLQRHLRRRQTEGEKHTDVVSQESS